MYDVNKCHITISFHFSFKHEFKVCLSLSLNALHYVLIQSYCGDELKMSLLPGYSQTRCPFIDVVSQLRFHSFCRLHLQKYCQCPHWLKVTSKLQTLFTCLMAMYLNYCSKVADPQKCDARDRVRREIVPVSVTIPFSFLMKLYFKILFDQLF